MKTFIFSEVSIDCKMTTQRGESSRSLLNLLSESDHRLIHSYRENADGIMVGKKTVDIDNPNLTNRFHGTKQPVRIIPSNSLDFDLNSNIFNNKAPTIIATSEKNQNTVKANKLLELGIEVVYAGKNEVDFIKLFDFLENKKGIKSIMVEGGGNLNHKLLENDLIDDIIILQLPIIVGGINNVTLVDGVEFQKIQKTLEFNLIEATMMDKLLFLKYSKRGR